MEKITITKEKFEQIKNLYLKEKLSLRDIANITGLSTTFISDILKKYNIYVYIEKINTTNFKKGDLKKSIHLIKDEFLKKEINFILEEESNTRRDFVAICKKTGKIFNDFENKSGILTEHLKKTYPDILIPTGFKRREIKKSTGVFWFEEYYNIKNTPQDLIKQYKYCKFCEWSTVDIDNKSGQYTLHLKNKHSIDIDDYIKLFPLEKELFKTHVQKIELKDFIELKQENNISCAICDEKMRKITNSHLKKHNMTLVEYREKYGTTLSITSREKFANFYKVFNSKVIVKREDTSIESLVFNKLLELDIPVEKQKRISNFYFDFFFPDYELFLETDGIYWHGHDRDCSWDTIPFNNIINDYKKSKKVDKLFHIIENISINKNNLNQINSKDSFFNFLTQENFNILNHKLFNLKENEIIFKKEYCVGKQDFFKEKNIPTNLEFLIKEFYPPNKYQKNIDINSRNTIESKLKGIFYEPFYKSHKVDNKNLFNLFSSNSNFLNKSIEYRLGINNSQEYFDISVKSIYRGIEVRTMFNVGILPVYLTKSVYEEFVGDNYTVFDPFAGWASRMLGMENRIKFNNCRYIGLDNNSELQNGYQFIINNYFKNYESSAIFSNFNSIEFIPEIENSIDFIFTSPPFFNDEIYTDNQIKYKNLIEWKENLLTPIFNNCYKYLKSGRYIVIDMKEKYADETLNSLLGSGFKFIEKKVYKVNKSHYSKVEKNQYLIVCKKS